MEKKKILGRIIAANAILGLVLSLVVFLPALADSNRGSNRGRGNGDDNRVRSESRRGDNANREVKENVVFENKVGSAVSGTARIDVFLTEENLHDARIKAEIRNMSSTSTSVFEGWLVDNDSGFKLSLGAFKMESIGSLKNGVWHYLESQEADILAGRTYVNVHSTAFLDGQIRGQIIP